MDHHRDVAEADQGARRLRLERDPSFTERDDAACAIAWRHDDREVIEVYVDPALGDRAEAICESVATLAGSHADIDTLSSAIGTYAHGENLSASIYTDVDDEANGVVAVAFTLG